MTLVHPLDPPLFKLNTKARVIFFTEVTTQGIWKKNFHLETKKASQTSDIPTRFIKENVDVFADFLCTSIYSFFKSSLFLSCLKFADVTPLHKKGRKDTNQNYRPASILPTLSKIYERSMFKQMSSCFEDIFFNTNVVLEKVLVRSNAL